MSPAGTRRRFQKDDGFTLPEVLVAMTMMVTVLFALYALFDTSVRIFSYGSDELEATENARLGLERMEREIRAAYPHEGGVLLDAGGVSEISFQNMTDDGPRTIAYGLSAGPESYLRRNNQRMVGPLDGEEGVVFAYCTTPADCSSTMADGAEVRLVRITLNAKVPGNTGATRTLTTDVYLRNREARP